MKKINIVIQQPDPEGPVFGPVMDPEDFMKSQNYAHEHSEQITKGLLVAGAADAQVSGLGATLTSGLSVRIAKGESVDTEGMWYETDSEGDGSSVVTMAAAHVSLPRIDLVIATLAIDTPVGSELKPYRRLRTQAELAANVAPYPPNQIEVAAELHTRAVISVKTGVPNASPAAPVAGAGEVALWQVHVAANQVTLGDGDLTDVRVLMKSMLQIQAEIAAAIVGKQDALNFAPVNKAGDSMSGALAITESDSGVRVLDLTAAGTAGGIRLEVASGITLMELIQGALTIFKVDADSTSPAVIIQKHLNDDFLMKLIGSGGDRNWGLLVDIAASGTNGESLLRLKNGVVHMEVTALGFFGLGVATPDLSGAGRVHMGGDSFRLQDSRSPASNAVGKRGEICWDDNFIYVCTATNTWKRSALTGGY